MLNDFKNMIKLRKQMKIWSHSSLKPIDRHTYMHGKILKHVQLCNNIANSTLLLFSSFHLFSRPFTVLFLCFCVFIVITKSVCVAYTFYHYVIGSCIYIAKLWINFYCVWRWNGSHVCNFRHAVVTPEASNKAKKMKKHERKKTLILVYPVTYA